MSERVTLSARTRGATGKNANRRLRARGITPAVFYNAAGVNLSLQVEEAALTKLIVLAGRTTVFDLKVEGNGEATVYPCLIWDTEYYPTKNRLQHVDFYGVDLDKELKVRVPLEFTGTAKGTKLGGALEIYREHIEVYSKPTALPQKIQTDITGLDVGHSLRVADLVMPEGVRASYDDNYLVIMVVTPGGDKEGEEEAEA
ncbi:MAG: 50S ribosomal protein L25/general stress protein Ctc [Desulfovibrio sp.]|nr:50S ribosomal protein L25/general stress protein Ctc [Desulfovibrio sp.]